MMDRRTFLGGMAATAVLAPRLTRASEPDRIEKIGLQLYTVRGEMKRNFDETIAKVAAIGYKEVEFAGYFKRTPQQVKAVLDRNGLTAPAMHVDYPSLFEKFPQVVADSQVIGHQYIVCPWIDENVRKAPDGWKRAAEVFNKAGEISQKAGIQFAYHNHHFEFVPVRGKFGYDILLEETDPKLVQFEMDLCWMTVAGQDPLQYFSRYPGRFPLVHVKDIRNIPRPQKPGEWVAFKNITPRMTAVGSGSIDWAKIFAHSGEAGIKHYFVEQDDPEQPFESIKSSYAYLEKLRF
jgi:sugar phosphate isomerase/epimerase